MQQQTKLSRENTILKNKLVHQDSQNHRGNLVFHGFPENRGENCDKRVRDVIRETGIDPYKVCKHITAFVDLIPTNRALT